MALTLEEIESTIVQLQEDLRRAKKARTLLLKKSKQDARLAEDLDKLLNKSKDSLNTKELELVVLDLDSDSIVEKSVELPESSLISPLVETILRVNKEEDSSLPLVAEEPIVFNTQQHSSLGALTEEEAEENIDKFF